MTWPFQIRRERLAFEPVRLSTTVRVPTGHSVPLVLSVDPRAPWEVTATFTDSTGDIVWVFARALIHEAFLLESSGQGDIRMCVIGDELLVNLESPKEGRAFFTTQAAPIEGWLEDTFRLCPVRSENVEIAAWADRALADLVSSR